MKIIKITNIVIILLFLSLVSDSLFKANFMILNIFFFLKLLFVKLFLILKDLMLVK